MIKQCYIQEKDCFNPHFRKQMNSKNVLIVKSEVGRSRPATMDLPEESFVYGKQFTPDREGAGKLISFWKLPELSQEQIREKDFAKYNKLALKKKVTTPRSINKFRKQKEIRLKKSDSLNYIKKPQIKRDKIFGQPTRATTPIVTVINFNYGRDGEQEMRENYIRAYTAVIPYLEISKALVPQNLVQQQIQDIIITIQQRWNWQHQNLAI